MRKLILWLSALVLGLGLTFGMAVPAPVQALPDFAEIRPEIEALMAMYDVPGVGIALIRDGEIIYEGGLGLRNAVEKTPVTPDTLFGMASVTKSFTALGVMMLVEEGRLDLDTPIIQYLPDFKLSDEEATRTVTLRHVLSHRSGLPRADSWVFTGIKSREDIIRNMASITLTTRPGGLWQYNNQNFVIAGVVIERVTGQTWEDFTRQRILEPLGMAGGNFKVSEIEAAPDHAAPHALDVLKGMVPIPFYNDMTPIGPAGSLNASVRAMAKYARFQLSNGTVNGAKLLSPEGLAELHREAVDISPNAGEAQATPEAAAAPDAPKGPVVPLSNVGYGLGWVTQDFRGNGLVEHGGNLPGFSTSVSFVPGKGIGVVLLTNANQANLFIEVARLRLTEWLLGLTPEQDLAADFNKLAGFDPELRRQRLEAARTYKPAEGENAPLLGEYDSPVGKLTVYEKDGALFMRQIIENTPLEIPLVPFERHKFLINLVGVSNDLLAFEIDAEGTVRIFQGEGRIQAGQKLGETVRVVTFKDPQGRYSFNVPAGLVAQTIGNLVVLVSTDPQGAFAAEAIAKDGDDPVANAERWFRMYDPTFNEKLVSSTPVRLPNGMQWTQLIYPGASGQLSVALVTFKGDTVYFVGVVATEANIQKLTPALIEILNSFRIIE